MKFFAIAAVAVGAVAAVKINRYDKDYKHPGAGFPAAYDEFPGTDEGAPKYDREMPVHFESKHDDDMFMNSMIEKYAYEGRNKDGSKNGKFYLDKEQGFRAAQEIVATHLGLTGDALKNYLIAYWDEAWEYYDVNRENKIEADRMTTLYRYLCKNARLNIQWASAWEQAIRTVEALTKSINEEANLNVNWFGWILKTNS